jgi:uncharacterized membrane protein
LGRSVRWATKEQRAERRWKKDTVNVKPDERLSKSCDKAWLLHRIFELAVLAKGLDGAVELIGGLLLLVLSPAAIKSTIFLLVQGELKEDPTDLVANLLVHNTSTVIQTRFAACAFLIVHGVVKLALVSGLVTNQLWSYPAAIVVFTGFTIYQVYQLTQQNSWFLEIVTILDIIVVLSVIAEYRHVKRARTHDA